MILFKKTKQGQMRTLTILGFSFTYDRNKFKRNKISPFSKIKNVKFMGANRVQKGANMFASKKDGIVIGEGTDIGLNCSMIAVDDAKITIGKNCKIGHNFGIGGMADITIGDYALVAPNVSIISSNHNYEDINTPIMFQGGNGKPVTIGEDVWLASDVKIVAGVSIGKHCIVGGVVSG